jgi:sortase A
MRKFKFYQFIIIRTIANSLILGSVVFLSISLCPLLKAELWYQYQQIRGARADVPDVGSQRSAADTGAARPALKVVPKSTEFGIIIEKIGVNAPIVANVDTTNHAAYMEALRHGVAHAKDTATPNKKGNVYLFAHSTLNFWELGEYATVFTLLHQLNPGDRIVLFYQGARYDYKVTAKEIVPGFDLTPLDRKSLRNVLTLQTCDPPGTTLRRLIITAEQI